MKTVSINKNKIFQKAYKKGLSCVSSNLVVYAVKNYTKSTRVGITASKKIGKAHDRNRAKRLVRAAFSEVLKENPYIYTKGFDIVFVCRVKTTISSFAHIKKSMDDIFKKLNLYD